MNDAGLLMACKDTSSTVFNWDNVTMQCTSVTTTFINGVMDMTTADETQETCCMMGIANNDAELMMACPPDGMTETFNWDNATATCTIDVVTVMNGVTSEMTITADPQDCCDNANGDPTLEMACPSI